MKESYFLSFTFYLFTFAFLLFTFCLEKGKLVILNAVRFTLFSITRERIKSEQISRAGGD